MSSFVPEGWRVNIVDDFAKTSAGGTPSTHKREYWDNGTIPWMSSGEVHKKRVHNVDQFISELGFKNSSAKLFPPKTILIALAGQGKTRGAVAISEIELTTNQSIAAVIIKDKSVSPDFVFYNLDSRYNELRSASGGSGRAGLNLSILGEQEVLLPPLPEQQKIVTILSSVDDVVEKVRAQINKLKDLKVSMMQELFTKGIGHVEFKDSSLGQIPADWVVHELGSLAKKIEGGGTPSRAEPSYWGKDIPWATVKDLRSISLTSTEEFITKKGLEKSSSKLIPANTLIIACRMAVGKAVYFDRDVAINQDLKAFYPIDSVDWRFLLHWYLSKSEQIKNLATGSTVKGIRLDDLRLLPIGLPPLSEQQVIANILSALDEKIEISEVRYEQSIRLKKALMQDLLTGKVRVNITDKESAVV